MTPARGPSSLARRDCSRLARRLGFGVGGTMGAEAYRQITCEGGGKATGFTEPAGLPPRTDHRTLWSPATAGNARALRVGRSKGSGAGAEWWTSGRTRQESREGARYADEAVHQAGWLHPRRAPDRDHHHRHPRRDRDPDVPEPERQGQGRRGQGRRAFDPDRCADDGYRFWTGLVSGHMTIPFTQGPVSREYVAGVPYNTQRLSSRRKMSSRLPRRLSL